MRHATSCLLILALAWNGQPLSAAVTSAQKKELNAFRTEINKIPALIGRKKLDEAEVTLADVEQRLEDYLKTEEISEKELPVRGLRQLIERHKASLAKAGGKPLIADSGFREKIAPILAEKCLTCHEGNARGGLRLDTFAGLEKGGANGPILVAGKPEASLLMARLLTPNPALRMPKDADALAAEEIKAIAAWIAGGAKFDGDDKMVRLDKLQPPKEPIRVARPTGNERVSFLKDVAPGFVVTCLRCHNGNNRQGGLSMVTFEKLMQGGDSGPVIVPEKLDESKLWTMINDGDMPRGQGRITREWYNNLKIWIDEGCKYDHDDPRAELAKLIPTEEDLKREELARLTPAQFAERRLTQSKEQWKKTLPKVEANAYESGEFHLLGDVSPDRLKTINGWAEEQIGTLRGMFDAKEEPLFRGKLTIFVFSDRFGYEEFNTTIHGREVPREVIGHSQVTPGTQDEAFVAVQDVGDEASADSPGLALNLMEQLTGAFLRRDAQGPLPDWLVRGTGLAVAGRSRLGEEFLRHQRQGAGTVLASARLERPEQIVENGTFSPADVGPVGLTLVEFLLKQGGNERFREVVRRMQAGENVSDALKAVYRTDTRSLSRAYAATLPATGVRKIPKN